MKAVAIAISVAAALGPAAAIAQTCGAVPNTLTNGSTADATAVMGNFNYLQNCINNSSGQFPGGRLTLSSGMPVPSGPVNSAGTVYYTPAVGSMIPIWNGTAAVPVMFTEMSNTLSAAGSAGPSAAAASSVYDLFVWSNGGALTLTRGPAWASSTSRSLNLARAGGILVNAAAITNGPAANFGTYVGTIMTDATGSTTTWNLGSAAQGGGAARIGLWNMYNRRLAVATVADANNNSHSYGVFNTWRPYDNSANNRVTFVIGQAEDSISATFATVGSAGSGGSLAIGVLLDNISLAPAGGTGYSTYSSPITVSSAYSFGPLSGLHFIQAGEAAFGATANYFDITFATLQVKIPY